jgi:hypothetical protein
MLCRICSVEVVGGGLGIGIRLLGGGRMEDRQSNEQLLVGLEKSRLRLGLRFGLDDWR